MQLLVAAIIVANAMPQLYVKLYQNIMCKCRKRLKVVINFYQAPALLLLWFGRYSGTKREKVPQETVPNTNVEQ